MTMRALPALAAALALASAGCAVPDLTRPSEVVRLRVLGIQAEPPEIAVGETTTFSYLVANPEGIEVENLWLLCAELDTGLGIPSCAAPVISLQDPTADTYTFTAAPETVVRRETLEDGTERDVTLQETLDELEPVRRVEGVGFQVYLMVLPKEDMDALLDDLAAGGGADPSNSEELEQALGDLFAVVAERGELAVKRVVVADKTAMEPAVIAGCEDLPGLAPNANPDLTAIARLDTVTQESLGKIGEGGTFRLAPGESITLVPRLADGSVERYYYIRVTDEQTECREEQPLFGWYATAGTYESDWSYMEDDGTPSPIVYTAPDEAPDEPIEAWLVTWDRRGGLDWQSFRFEVSN